jgi:hypothetical protein
MPHCSIDSLMELIDIPITPNPIQPILALKPTARKVEASLQHHPKHKIRTKKGILDRHRRSYHSMITQTSLKLLYESFCVQAKFTTSDAHKQISFCMALLHYTYLNSHSQYGSPIAMHLVSLTCWFFTAEKKPFRKPVVK